jgi:hypothetical protein
MFKYTPRNQLFPDNEGKALLKGLVKSYLSVHGNNSLIKSFSLEMNGKPLTQWLPEHGINTKDSEHPWYHQFEGGVAHHPPFAFDPESEDLLWHNEDDPSAPHSDQGTANRPHGFHPMDYMIYDLSRMFADLLGGTKEDGEKFVRDNIISPAIDDHNASHLDAHGNPTHVVPHIDSVEWRMNHVGGRYDKRGISEDRANRGSTPSPEGFANPLLNYSLNMGNVDHPHADRGVFIDGGINPIHNEMGQRVKNIMKYFEQDEFIETMQQMDPRFLKLHQNAMKRIDKALKDRYLAHSNIPLHELTFGHVVGRQGNRGKAKGRPDGSGYRTNIAADDHPLNNLHPLQLAEIAPQAFYDTKTFAYGKDSESRKMVITPESIIARGKEFGVNISDDEAELLSRQPKSSYLFGGAKKQIKEGNYGPKILRSIAEDLGVDMDSNEYKDMAESIHVSDMGTKGGGRIHNSRHIAAIPAYYAKLLERQGVPADEALQRAITEFRDHDHQASRHDRNPKAREIAERIHAQMREARGIPDLAEGALGYSPLGDEFRHSQTHGQLETVVPRHHEGFISDEVAHPNKDKEEEIQANRQSEMPVPTPAPMGEAPPMDNMPPQLPQGQMTLDQFPTKAHVAEITEAMEHIQLEDAKRDDSILKMVPHNPIQLNSIQSVGLFAKDLGITSMDVHGLLHSRGDWHRIAKEWSVSPQVVKVVKVTFSGGI